MDMVQDKLGIPLNKFMKTIDLSESMTELPLMSGVSRGSFPYSEASTVQLHVEYEKQHICLETAEH